MKPERCEKCREDRPRSSLVRDDLTGAIRCSNRAQCAISVARKDAREEMDQLNPEQPGYAAALVDALALHPTAAEETPLERRRRKVREYMRAKRAGDPEFQAKERERQKKRDRLRALAEKQERLRAERKAGGQ